MRRSAKKAAKKKAVAKKVSGKKAVAKKPFAKKAPVKTIGPKRKSVSRKVNPAFVKAMTPSAALAAVIGTAPMPRAEVTKKLWAYIERHGLQDSKKKGYINADDNLREIFGGKKAVSMIEMTNFVNGNLSKKEKDEDNKTNDPGPYITDRKR